MMTWTMISAGIAAAVAFWGQLRGFLSRFTSLVIVTADVELLASQALLDYCWRNYSRSPFGRQRFSSITGYVKPIKKFQPMATEHFGEALTFFDGWRPLFISGRRRQNDGEINSHNITVTFIRGTFDIEKMLVKAMDHLIARNQGEKEATKNRFHVVKIFGVRKNGNGYDRGEVAKSNAPSDERGYRILKWEESEVGLPSPKNPFGHLAYGKEVDDLITHIKHWATLSEWYNEKGIPHTIGVSFYGPPGTGKTSLARAIAQMLDIPIYIMDLNTMSNEELSEAWGRARNDAPCMVLFEDLDRLFNEKREFVPKEGLSLNVLLNCIQGVEPSDGIITVVTANHIERVDEALGVPKNGESSRPGRIDKHIFLGPLGMQEREKIVRRILDNPSEKDVLDTAIAGSGETGAQFTKRCELIALERKWDELRRN